MKSIKLKQKSEERHYDVIIISSSSSSSRRTIIWYDAARRRYGMVCCMWQCVDDSLDVDPLMWLLGVASQSRGCRYMRVINGSRLARCISASLIIASMHSAPAQRRRCRFRHLTWETIFVVCLCRPAVSLSRFLCLYYSCSRSFSSRRSDPTFHWSGEMLEICADGERTIHCRCMQLYTRFKENIFVTDICETNTQVDCVE